VWSNSLVSFHVRLFAGARQELTGCRMYMRGTRITCEAHSGTSIHHTRLRLPWRAQIGRMRQQLSPRAAYKRPVFLSPPHGRSFHPALLPAAARTDALPAPLSGHPRAASPMHLILRLHASTARAAVRALAGNHVERGARHTTPTHKHAAHTPTPTHQHGTSSSQHGTHSSPRGSPPGSPHAPMPARSLAHAPPGASPP